MRFHLIKKVISLLIVLSFVFYDIPLLYADGTKKEYSFKELNEMEIRADMARQYYWRGDYQKAIDIFKELTAETHPSKTLYLDELASSYLAAGDFQQAERSFFNVYELLETYYDRKLEEKALSEFGKEEEKIYRGAPYEQSTGMLLLSLMFLDKGDRENALAAIKTAAMADSDATENMYNSDYTLLHLLEGKIYQLMGDNEEFIRHRGLAVESYRITHPDVRDIFSERLDQIVLLKMSPDDRQKLDVEKSDEEIKKKISELDEKLKTASLKINAEADLGAFYNGKYNTLILVPKGESPYKTRKGKDAQMVVFRDVTIETQPVKITIDGKPLDVPPVSHLADVAFQAETRGGRRMDAILNGQAAFRSTTVGIGNLFTELSDDVGGYIGLGMLVVGLVAQGMGGAISPEADTRCWETLPREYDVYALKLPTGEHIISFEQFLYFEKVNKIDRKIRIENEDSFAVAFGMPSLVGLYSSQSERGIKLSKRDLRDRKTLGEKIIITPPLAVNRIERFTGEGEDNEPEACAPDSKRIMRKIRKALKKKNIPAYLVSHREIIRDREKLSSNSNTALQIRLKGLKKIQKHNGQDYMAEFEMSLVNTLTGQKLYSREVTGHHTSNESEPTKGFYGCLEDSLNQFISTEEFSQAIQVEVSSITAQKGDGSDMK